MRTLPRILLAGALCTSLAACGFATEAGSETGGDQTDETSMPADEDVQPDGTVSQDEAEVVANAYVGLTEEQAEEQAEIDGRAYRVGARDGEQFMLTEDYVLGRITVTITDGFVTAATVEATGGPVTVGN